MTTTDRAYSVFDIGGRSISYSFTPAARDGMPLVVILHGHSKTPAASRYRHPDWNVLCPVDNFGFGGFGSWYLGEGGDYFWLEAMPALINHVHAGQQIYFCGSSMGGYGAILHGSRLGARGVYANIAQTRLLGSTYSEKQGMRRFFAQIFGEDVDPPYNDLRSVLRDDLPTSFILSGLRWDKPGYIEEQTLPFLEALCGRGINFQSELRFGSGHGMTYTMAEAIELFVRNAAAIDDNYLAKTQPETLSAAPSQEIAEPAR